jgi:crotonobetainyl-CoA:carnitine CoA-transferase CaiB-like acyl-CoA transferase
MTAATRAAPLAGVRVLDLSRILAGPWAGQLLADYGAEVIKVERPGAGDDTRGWGPPFVNDAATGEPGDASYFLSCNRGKKSVTIDFTRPEGRDLVLALAAKADVLLENYKVGGLAKYGLDYASLSGLNPRLVYCSVTGFGQTGPYAKRPGYDFLIQAMGGLMSITGERDDRPGGGPQKVGVALTDVMTGLYATTAVLAALHERDRSGQGQHIDLALLDVQIAALANQSANYLTTGKAPGRLGNDHPSIVPYQAFKAKDGYLILAVGNDTQFRSFCEQAGLAGVPDDARFANNAARVRNREALTGILAAVFPTRTVDEWIAMMETANVPCGPINTLDRVFADPQVIARGMRVDMPHERYGTVPVVRNPVQFSATPVEHRDAPPLLGAHNGEILGDLLGTSAADLARLADAGII